mmetsp:Transcript_26370/g.25534  ORF Transcript_26370/g.25534 Transcript_26370/m.25534 type:complete len:89 (+) Transcript_26370:962-1228(+)
MFRHYKMFCSNSSILKKNKLKFHEIHSNFYYFSFIKLQQLIKLKHFAYIYCYYYKEVIVGQGRIKNKNAMQRKENDYLQACHYLLKFC